MDHYDFGYYQEQSWFIFKTVFFVEGDPPSTLNVLRAKQPYGNLHTVDFLQAASCRKYRLPTTQLNTLK
jgi:hypothetical protein